MFGQQRMRLEQVNYGNDYIPSNLVQVVLINGWLNELSLSSTILIQDEKES